MKRKQIQYALNKLGLYNSTIDGLWGKNTALALENYQKISENKGKNSSQLFESILTKVKVPKSFTSKNNDLETLFRALD